MTRRPLLLGLLLASVVLAGCGTPDEQEPDENAQSEQESVGEGEVPGFEPALAIGAAAVALVLLARRQR